MPNDGIAGAEPAVPALTTVECACKSSRRVGLPVFFSLEEIKPRVRRQKSLHSPGIAHPCQQIKDGCPGRRGAYNWPQPRIRQGSRRSAVDTCRRKLPWLCVVDHRTNDIYRRNQSICNSDTVNTSNHFANYSGIKTNKRSQRGWRRATRLRREPGASCISTRATGCRN